MSGSLFFFLSLSPKPQPFLPPVWTWQFHCLPRCILALPGLPLNCERHPSNRSHGCSRGPPFTTWIQIILPKIFLGRCHPHSQLQTKPICCLLIKGQLPPSASQGQAEFGLRHPLNNVPLQWPSRWGQTVLPHGTRTDAQISLTSAPLVPTVASWRRSNICGCPRSSVSDPLPQSMSYPCPSEAPSQFIAVEKQRLCYQLDLESNQGPLTQPAQSHSWWAIPLSLSFLISEGDK